MAKMLKPLIVVLLILSIVSLTFGIMLFNQREIIKGRTQRLENSTLSFARSIHFDDIRLEQLKDYATMQAALNRLNVFAGNMYQELQDTILDLANTKLDLEQTREELRITQNQLEAARQQIARLEDTVREREAEIARANQQIAQLERDKASLESRISSLESQLAEAEEEKRDLSDEIVTLNDQIKSLEKLILQLTGDDSQPVVPYGLSGRILAVNPDWNFVILDIGSEEGLGVNAEMLVHRRDELVGKVRISSVEDHFAIAEILNDWLVRPLRRGDTVLY